MKWRTAVISLAIMCFIQASAWSKSRPADSISLGTATLTLGMPEQEVLQKLSAEFQLGEPSRSGAISILQVCGKATAQAGPCIGSVTFDNGRLVEAIRRWPQRGTTAEMVKFLNTTASRFVAEGYTSCRLDSVNLRDKFSVDESSLIICGNKQLRIGFITREPQAEPYILEVLQGTPQH